MVPSLQHRVPALPPTMYDLERTLTLRESLLPPAKQGSSGCREAPVRSRKIGLCGTRTLRGEDQGLWGWWFPPGILDRACLIPAKSKAEHSHGQGRAEGVSFLGVAGGCQC